MVKITLIDELTESIRKFGVSRDNDTFDSELDFIMSKMSSVEIVNEPEDIRWDHLQSDYSKLKYLSQLINFYYLPDTTNFRKSLSKFMDTLDSRTQYYLSEINWDDAPPDILEDNLRIKEFFEMSLNENDPIERLNTVIKGYQILVPMVEVFRNEKHKHTLEPDFLSEFERPTKRSKN